jgi:hypothetical protein
MVTVVLLSGAVQAVTMEWGGVMTITDDADVSTSGNLEYAYHADGASLVTLNGVVFSAGGIDFGGDVALSGMQVRDLTNAHDQIFTAPEVDGYETVTNRYLTAEQVRIIELKIEQNE